MADHSHHSSDSESGTNEKFYRLLEEYTQQVRQRYNMSVRPNIPRIKKKSDKPVFELK